MNIFQLYLEKITEVIAKNKKILNLKTLNDFKNVIVEKCRLLD